MNFSVDPQMLGFKWRLRGPEDFLKIYFHIRNDCNHSISVDASNKILLYFILFHFFFFFFFFF